MRATLRDLAAVLIAVVAVVASGIAAGNTWVDPGIRLGYEDGQVVITSVEYASAAQRDGLEAGLVVMTLDGQDVLTASDATKRSIADRGSSLFPWHGLSVVSRDQIPVELRSRAEFAANTGFPYIPWDTYTYNAGAETMQDLGLIGFGVLILLGGWLWLGTGRGGTAFRPYAFSLPLATAIPVLVLPIDHLPAFNATLVAAVALPAGMVPLGLEFASRLEEGRSRWLGYSIVLAFAIATLGAGLFIPERFLPGAGHEVTLARSVLAASIVFVPGATVARPLGLGARPVVAAAGISSSDGSTETMLAAVTPGVSCLSLLWSTQYVVWPILLWLAAITGRQAAIGSVRRLLTRTTRQRDLVVSATEAERARIAADIHDYALQDLTMLVRRLDAAGDAENAGAAREVAERLRVICGDLRLPVLDDLGVGPALEWLCARFEPTAGHITLDRLADEKRLPPDEELAFFRVAQEAVANAARHGAPPILIRYRGGGTWAELEVDDSGTGLAPDAAERAELSGHLGLLNMTQRAEAIGGQLTIGRRPGGGTRVRLAWESVEADVAPGTATPATPGPEPRPSAKPA
jgi:signal transduction histidine kinase